MTEDFVLGVGFAPSPGPTPATSTEDPDDIEVLFIPVLNDPFLCQKGSRRLTNKRLKLSCSISFLKLCAVLFFGQSCMFCIMPLRKM